MINYNISADTFYKIKGKPDFVKMYVLRTELSWGERIIFDMTVSGNINNVFKLVNKDTKESMDAQCARKGGKVYVNMYRQSAMNLPENVFATVTAQVTK